MAGRCETLERAAAAGTTTHPQPGARVPAWTTARARRHEALARGDVAAAKAALQDLDPRIEEHHRRAVEAALPLSESQRARLGALLLTGLVR